MHIKNLLLESTNFALEFLDKRDLKAQKKSILAALERD